MTVAQSAARLVAALAAALSFAACGGTVDVLIEKDLGVNSAVAGGVVTAPVDMAAEAAGAWKHRDKVDKVTVSLADAEVTAVFPPTAAGTTVSGAVWLLPEGQTSPGAGAVKVGDFADEPVVVGTVIQLTLSPELNGFVESTFNGNGRFVVYAQGAGAGGAVVNCVLHARLGAAVKWKVF